MKKFEIWIGNGDGAFVSQKLAEVEARTFRIACYLYVLKNQYDRIIKDMENPNSYIEDIHFGYTYYDPKLNGCSWIGKFYETKEEADKSFN